MPRLPLLGAVAFLALAMWAASSTTGGALAAVYVYAFLNFFAGVFSLVALSLTVMGGLVATDRFFLRIGHRVFFQGLHRATAIIAMVFLGLHISMKIMSGSATLIDPFVPFANLAQPLYIGLGTIASYLMFTIFWTGIIRARFAGSGKPWMWRTLHSSAYVAWPAALGHGLNAGRPAATWVILSYGACVVGVVIALLVRIYVTLGRRTTGPKSAPTAVGINMETAVIPRIADAPLRRESDLETTAERIRTSTRETRVVAREDVEPAVAEVAPRSARPAMEPAARAREDRGREDRGRDERSRDARRPAGPRERPAGYAMPPADVIASPAEERWSEPVVSRAEPEPRRSRSARSDGGRESRPRYEEEPERRSRSASAPRERERERVEEPRDRRGRTQVGRRRSEEKRGLTQWRRRERAEEKQREAEEDREWYESLRNGRDEAVEPVSAERYSPTSAEPWSAPERSEQSDRYRRSERSERAESDSRRADRWTSPADERYGEAPVSAPAARYDEPRYEESRYEESRYEDSRYDSDRDRDEERPRRLLRLVTDDESKPSRRSRHSVDEQPEERSRRRGAEYDSEPGYGRPGPYPPAVDPAPSRRARRSAADGVEAGDRPRRGGRRAAGGEDLDVGDGAYWTRPREGYGR